MNFAEVGRTLLRRWYLTLTGVVLTAVLCAAAVIMVGPTYEDKATVLLLPPVSSLASGENPYLGLSGLEQSVDVLVRSLNAQSVQLDVRQRWPGAEFTIAPDVETSGPIILITSENGSAEEAADLTSYLLTRVPVNLADLQSGLNVRARSQITSMVLTQYDQPEVIRSGQLRVGLGAVAAGLALTVLLVGLLDGLLSRRRQRGVDESSEVVSVNWQGWYAQTATPESVLIASVRHEASAGERDGLEQGTGVGQGPGYRPSPRVQ